MMVRDSVALVALLALAAAIPPAAQVRRSAPYRPEVNLIINSERGGQQSDALCADETLKMADTYLKAGGRPDRWIVQSWHPHPERIVPETDPNTLTGLVKRVIERVRATR